MKNCIIFCAGDFVRLIEPVTADDLILAADGGLIHTNALGLTPHGILGDFDSLGYVPENAKVFPIEKDDTDAMLAVRHGLKHGCRRFLLYGSLDGPRLDHTVANFQTLQFLADHGATGFLVGTDWIATVVKDGTLSFSKESTGVISVFCMGSDATGIDLKGLKYPLEQGTLTAGFPLGVSNRFTGCAASVSVESGSLLVLWSSQSGLPNHT